MHFPKRKLWLAVFVFLTAILGVSYFVTVPAIAEGGAPHDDSVSSCITPDQVKLQHLWSHTWDPVARMGVFTFHGTTPMCQAVGIPGSMFRFDHPELGHQYPQTLLNTEMLTTFTFPGKYNLSGTDACGQYDVSVAFAGQQGPPLHLLGPGNPYEPPFLSDYSDGPVTYGHDEPSSCVPSATTTTTTVAPKPVQTTTSTTVKKPVEVATATSLVPTTTSTTTRPVAVASQQLAHTGNQYFKAEVIGGSLLVLAGFILWEMAIQRRKKRHEVK